MGFVLFSFVTVAFGALASVFLQFFVINPVAVALGFTIAPAFGLGIALIAYHYMMAEIFIQLSSHHESSKSIKRILAKRVFASPHKGIVARRPLSKKKKSKK